MLTIKPEDEASMNKLSLELNPDAGCGAAAKKQGEKEELIPSAELLSHLLKQASHANPEESESYYQIQSLGKVKEKRVPSTACHANQHLVLAIRPLHSLSPYPAQSGPAKPGGKRT